VGMACACGSRSKAGAPGLACLECGAPCCWACTFELGPATYCARCAESVVAGGLPLNLVALIRSWSAQAAPRAGTDAVDWLIVVAREHPALFRRLMRAFSGDQAVQIVLDRRRDRSRNPPGVQERLQARGAAALKRPRPATTSGKRSRT
jgi:hypothetical protein